MCHARYLARKAVKARMKAAGWKVSHIEARIVHAQANAYLDQHRDELLAQATMAIDGAPGLRKLAEAEAQRRRRTVRIMTRLPTVPTSTRPISQRSQTQPTVHRQS
jgi:hypothetical protein